MLFRSGAIQMTDTGVEANLRLYPPDLGGVRVHLTVNSDSTVQASFIAETAETAQLLDQNMGHFRQALSQHGLAVDKIQVAVQTPSGSTSSGTTGNGSEQRSWSQEQSTSDQQRRQASQRESDSSENPQQHPKSRNQNKQS